MAEHFLRSARKTAVTDQILRMNRTWVELIGRPTGLKAGAVDTTMPSVWVTTMHRAKGLEFFAVAITFFAETAFPPAL